MQERSIYCSMMIVTEKLK